MTKLRESPAELKEQLALQDAECLTALEIAAKKGHLLVMKALLKAGADKSIASKSGRTPLYLAASSGHHQVMELLIAEGTDKDAVSSFD